MAAKWATYDEQFGKIIKNSEDIALKIIEHYFSYFLENNCPRIIINDDNKQLVVNDLFGIYTKQSVITKGIVVNTNNFSIRHC